MDLAQIGRSPTELDCLNALLRPSVWDLLLTGTNSRLSKEMSSGNLSKSRRNSLGDLEFLKSVLFARLDMIARGTRTIEVAYQVRVSILLSSPSLVLIIVFLGEHSLVVSA